MIYVLSKIKYLYSAQAPKYVLGIEEEQQDTDTHIFSPHERMHT